jgi:hypothetical protein
VVVERGHGVLNGLSGGEREGHFRHADATANRERKIYIYI